MSLKSHLTTSLYIITTITTALPTLLLATTIIYKTGSTIGYPLGQSIPRFIPQTQDKRQSKKLSKPAVARALGAMIIFCGVGDEACCGAGGVGFVAGGGGSGEGLCRGTVGFGGFEGD